MLLTSRLLRLRAEMAALPDFLSLPWLAERMRWPRPARLLSLRLTCGRSDCECGRALPLEPPLGSSDRSGVECVRRGSSDTSGVFGSCGAAAAMNASV